MMRSIPRAGLRMALALLPLAIAPLAVSADAPASSAVIIISDTGMSPVTVTIAVGGDVTWVNQGANVHTASSVHGAPLPFDSGGLGPGQKYNLGFGVTGTYPVTSSPDCISPSNPPGFNCSAGFSVIVAPAGPAQPAAGPASAPAPATQNADVAVNDSGFSPPSVTIQQGGTVTWSNTGLSVHSATSLQSAPLQFNTGNIGSYLSTSLAFPMPGTYNYTSGADCLFGTQRGAFGCGGTYSVIVLPAAGAPQPAGQPAPALPQNATVTINDRGFTPETVTVALGGSVTWVNQGTQTHTATTLGGVAQPFDSGGASAGQSYTFAFGTAGTYVYSSAPDCLNGYNNPQFACSHAFSVVVGPAPALPTAPAAPSAAASGATVIIDDGAGFQPNNITVRAGGTVTWVNRGHDVHSVVSNPGVLPSFDSGGLGTSQSFSQTFTASALYSYHSSIEQIYTTDQATQSVVVSYKFNGSVAVQ